MSIQQGDALPTYAVCWVRLLAISILLLGIMVLCGWIFAIEGLKRVLPGLVSMKANTALGLALSGGILYWQTIPRVSRPSRWLRAAGIALVMMIGLVTLAEYQFDWDPGIDRLFFTETDNEIYTARAGRMAIPTAVCFVVIAAALSLSEWRRYWSLAQLFAVVAGGIALLLLLRYLYGDIAFAPIGNSTAMAIHAAAAILLLSMAVLISTSNAGFASRMKNNLPLVVGVALLLLFLLVGGAALHRVEQSRQSARLLEGSYQVSLHLEAVVSSLHEYRAGIQSFLVTLQESRLLDAERARRQLFVELGEVDRLTAGGSEQRQRLASLQSMVEQLFSMAADLIRLRREQGSESLAISALNTQADRLSADIIQRLDKVNAFERSLSHRQKQLAASKDAASASTLVFCALLGLLLLFAAIMPLRREIAERTLSEKRLKESEARLRALFDTSAIGIVVVDEQGHIEEFNPASELMFGYSSEEVLGQNVKILMPEPYRSEHDGYIKGYLNKGQSSIIGTDRELSAKTKDNEIFPIELRLSEANLGSHRKFVAFIKDISARKAMEARSRYLEAIVASSDDAIMSKTLDGIITSWNASAEQMFGYSADEVVGKPMVKLIPEDRREEEKFILEQLVEGRRVNHFETVRIRKDGSPVEVSVSLSPIIDETGKIIGASKIAREITRSKQLERELYAAKQAAENANHSKSHFLANMSHEIRTPMNAIIGLTRLAMETQLTLQQQDYLQKIHKSSQALMGILNDILDLSKIESGRMEIERIEFNPTQMLQSVSDLFIARVEEKGLELFLDIAPDIPLTLMGDPLRIQQVLSNLVGNAIKFTNEGEIHIRMELVESRGEELLLRIGVRDTGIGIGESVIKQLFQPFSQADASITRKYGGTGLGLVISKQLVELMGGDITVSSRLGEGSTFSFTLRCGKGRPYSWDEDSYRLKNSRAMVVDDQNTSHDILKSMLESWHFQVDTAPSAEQGLEQIHQAERAGAPFNLLVLDWKMKGMSGLDLAHELALEEFGGHSRHYATILMATAYEKDQLLKEVAGSAARPDAILTKPVVPSTLFNTILNVYHYLSSHQGQPAESELPINFYEAAQPLHHARILLVEDNELNQQVAVEFLMKAGMRVTIANHGGEAIQQVRTKKFDAVLMDLQMPEMDGYEATRRIRDLPGGQALPVIAMTAAAMAQDREACLAAGMNDHVAKPIDPRELIETLLRWIRPADAGLVLTPGDEDNAHYAELAERLPGFELGNVMTMLAGDQAQLLRVLAAFREQFAGEATAIAEEIERGEMAAARNRVHALKGVAGNLGARALYLACKTLDDELKAGHYDATTVDEWVEVFERTMATLAALPGPSEDAPSSEGTPDMEALRQVLAELDALLASDRFVSDNLLTRLKMLLPDHEQGEYATLTRHILATDYPEARVVLKSITEMLNGKS